MIPKKTVLSSIKNHFRSGRIQRAKIMVNVDGNLYPVKTLCYLWLNEEHVGAWRFNLDSSFSYVDSDGEYKDLPEEFIEWRTKALKYLLGKTEPITTTMLTKVWDGANPFVEDDYLEGYILYGDIVKFDKKNWGVYLDGDTIVFGGKPAFDAKEDTPFTAEDLRTYSVDCGRIHMAQQFLHQVDLKVSMVDITLKLESRFTDIMKRQIEGYWNIDHISTYYTISFTEDEDTNKINIRITGND